MRIAFAVLAAFLLFSGAARTDDVKSNPEQVKKDLAALEGEWSMVSGERDGQALPEDAVKTFKRVVKGDETTVSNGDQVFMKAKFKIDSSKKPKTIDYTLLEGPNKDKKVLGIFEIDGDTAKFCFSGPDKERPTDFTAAAGSGRTLSTWKKNKK